MPKQLLHVSIFVASPGDLGPEREALETTVGELNRSSFNRRGVHLDLIRWETHSFPQFGDDPQSIINSQVPQDYDIFIGILWTRFGTPTPRAESGTKEEFDNAVRRRSDAGNPPLIMLYFKPPHQNSWVNFGVGRSDNV